jgi:hypothetical protein
MFVINVGSKLSRECFKRMKWSQKSVCSVPVKQVKVHPDEELKPVNDLDPTDSDFERYLQIKQNYKQKRKERKEAQRHERLQERYKRIADTKDDLPDTNSTSIDSSRLSVAALEQLIKERVPFRAGIDYGVDGRPVYGLWKNSMFVQRKRSDIRVGRSYRLIDPHLTGPALVFDFSYDEYMNASELRNLAFQIAYCVSLVQSDSGLPFAVHFSNLAVDSLSEKVLKKSIGNLNQCATLINISRQSLLEQLPKDKTIYLSPHAEQCLETFEPDANYVIGGFIDQSFPKPLSHVKAAEAGVRCYRLPIDEHLNWKMGCKYLPLPQVTSILIDVKNQCDWKKALSDNVRKMYQMTDEERKGKKCDEPATK